MREDLIWKAYYGDGNPNLVEAFEQSIDKRLPDAYKKIVSKFNGACVNPDTFSFHSQVFNKRIEMEVGAFIPYGEAIDGILNIEAMIEDRDLEIPVGLVPFSSLADGDYLCFDFRSRDARPPVVVWHTQNPELTSIVSETFEAFLEALY